MGHLFLVGAIAFVGLLQTPAAEDGSDKPKQDSGSSLSALLKLADQFKNDDPETQRARPVVEDRPARNRKEMPEAKADEKARPAAKADRANPKRAEDDVNDPRPPRRVRDPGVPRPPAAVNRAANERARRGDWWGGPIAANPGFGPVGGYVWSPVPFQPVYYGYGLSGYGYYSSYGYGGAGYGFNSYYPYFYGGFFPPRVVSTLGPPVEVRYEDPAGRLRQSMLDAARRNAGNPAGLFPGRR